MAKTIIAPSGDPRTALLHYREAVGEASAYLRTMATMMLNELCTDDDGLGDSDPRSLVQRRFAILDCMEKYIDDLDAANQEVAALVEMPAPQNTDPGSSITKPVRGEKLVQA